MPTAVVTGAGSGIGRAAALALAARGLDVALLGRTRSKLDETARETEKVGRRATAIACDVGRAEDVARAAMEVLAEAVPSVVVNNAGIVGRVAPIEEVADDDWDAVMSANLRALFLVTRAFLPAMRAAKRGRFVNVASISATLGTPRIAAYVASNSRRRSARRASPRTSRRSGARSASRSRSPKSCAEAGCKR
jgi:3-oxoacyl-[acyl-carrier protein] reductase